MKLVTAAQMRAMETRAVDAGTPLAELMEQAGLAVAQEAWLSLGTVAGRRIVVLAGPGDNGGDGLVAARYLADWEAEVAVYLLRPRDETDVPYTQLCERDTKIILAADDKDYALLDSLLASAEIVIDALLGIGPRRAIEGALEAILQRVSHARQRSHPPTIIAVDLPTGVAADSGAADESSLRADITVTFGFAKVGLYLLPGSEFAGRVEVVDIGLPKSGQEDVRVELMSTAFVRERLPARAVSGNKGTFGRVLVVAGSRNYVGAARLCAEACYRAGAGLVTVACPASVQAMLAPALAEATWLPLADDDGEIDLAAVASILETLAACNVMLIGPGLGPSAGARQLVSALLSDVPASVRATVIDADGLNALAAQAGWEDRVAGACVLTPHPGEMARLLGTSVTEVQTDRLNIALGAAARWRQIVVLKGAHTIVAAADGRAAISPHANPLLATGGTGDVLAGAIAGLIAQGMAPFDAAVSGVYVHGLAAEELSQELGDGGLLASDLLPALPRAIRTIIKGPRQHGASAMPDLAAFSTFGLGRGVSE